MCGSMECVKEANLCVTEIIFVKLEIENSCCSENNKLTKSKQDQLNHYICLSTKNLSIKLSFSALTYYQLNRLYFFDLKLFDGSFVPPYTYLSTPIHKISSSEFLFISWPQTVWWFICPYLHLSIIKWISLSFLTCKSFDDRCAPAFIFLSPTESFKYLCLQSLMIDLSLTVLLYHQLESSIFRPMITFSVQCLHQCFSNHQQNRLYFFAYKPTDY